MAKPDRGLGRGLEALLGDMPQESGEAISVDIHLLDPNRGQARKHFDQAKLAELSESIKLHGVIQPLLVQKVGERYKIIAGERRYRAARLAGLKEVPIIVREYDEKQLLEVSLIENIQRSDLNPIEESVAIRFLMQQYDLTQEEVAERLSKSRPAIANSLRLLSLPEDILELIRSGSISSGHARALLSVAPGEQRALAKQVVEQGLSVRELEKRAKTPAAKPAKTKKQKTNLPPELNEAEENLRAHLRTRVKFAGDTASGKIIIEYFTAEELERIYAMLMGMADE